MSIYSFPQQRSETGSDQYAALMGRAARFTQAPTVKRLNDLLASARANVSAAQAAKVVEGILRDGRFSKDAVLGPLLQKAATEFETERPDTGQHAASRIFKEKRFPLRDLTGSSKLAPEREAA